MANAKKSKQWVPSPQFVDTLRAYCNRQKLSSAPQAVDGMGLSVETVRKHAQQHLAARARDRRALRRESQQIESVVSDVSDVVLDTTGVTVMPVTPRARQHSSDLITPTLY